MKKILIIALSLGCSILLLAGCQSASTPATTAEVDSTTAQSYSAIGVSMIQGINESVAGFTESGSVSGGIISSAIKAAIVQAETVTGPDINGYYRITEEASTSFITYEADIYIKLVTNESGLVTDTYVYGSYTYEISSLNMVVTFGDGVNNPYQASSTWSGNTLTSLSADGPLVSTITSGGNTTVMTYTISSFSLPVTTGNDYPTGSMSVAFSFNNSTLNEIMTISFTGTSSATLTYLNQTLSISVPAS